MYVAGPLPRLLCMLPAGGAHAPVNGNTLLSALELWKTEGPGSQRRPDPWNVPPPDSAVRDLP